MPRFAPRIKKHPDGTCSLIGLTPTMLSDIFMSAALYRHEDDNRREADRPACLAKIDAASDTMMQEVMRENLEEGDRWCRNITTVHLVVEADSNAQADDAIYEMLSNNLMFRTAKPDTTPLLLDWAFLNDGQTCCEPSRMPDGVPDDLEDVYLTPCEPAANAMINAVSLVRDLARMVTPRDPDQIADYCKEYGKDPADMTEDDLEEMESDLENDRVWSDALASYQMIRSAREIVKALTMAARENNASVVDTQSPVADAAAPAI